MLSRSCCNSRAQIHNEHLLFFVFESDAELATLPHLTLTLTETALTNKIQEIRYNLAYMAPPQDSLQPAPTK